MCLGGHLDAVLPGEALIAAWDVEEVLVGVGSNQNGGDLLLKVALDYLDYDAHVENATNIIILLSSIIIIFKVNTNALLMDFFRAFRERFF